MTRSKVKVTSPSELEIRSGYFKKLSLTSFTIEAGNWPLILKLNTISKFNPSGFLIFGLVIVSRDFKLDTNVSCEEPTVSIRTYGVNSLKVTCVDLDNLKEYSVGRRVVVDGPSSRGGRSGIIRSRPTGWQNPPGPCLPGWSSRRRRGVRRRRQSLERPESLQHSPRGTRWYRIGVPAPWPRIFGRRRRLDGGRHRGPGSWRACCCGRTVADADRLIGRVPHLCGQRSSSSR